MLLNFFIVLILRIQCFFDFYFVFNKKLKKVYRKTRFLKEGLLLSLGSKPEPWNSILFHGSGLEQKPQGVAKLITFLFD